MARELRDRYASMTDVVVDLGRVTKGLAPVGPHRQPSHLPRLSVLVVGMIAVAALAGVAILYCGMFKAFVVDDANPAYSSNTDGVLFNKTKTTLVSYPYGRNGSYSIPSSVSKIGDWAFYKCLMSQAAAFALVSVVRLGFA